MKKTTYFLLANLLAFMPLSAAPFTDNNNGTVTDSKTGLIWQQCSVGLSGTNCATGAAQTKAWLAAPTACADLNTTPPGGFAGHTNWRLPSVNELLSIVDKSKNSPAIDTSVFPATVANSYWSSTTYVFFTSLAWLVYFDDGNGYNFNKTGSYYVRCVSSGP